MLGVVAVGSAAITLASARLRQISSAVPTKVVSREASVRFDDTKIRALAASQNVPLPPNLRVTAPAASVPASLAGYLGAWGGDQGWNGKGRHVILVIESIDKSGTAVGVFALGPQPDPAGPDRRPARYRSIAGTITDAGLAGHLRGRHDPFRDTSDGLMWGRWEVGGERSNELTISLERVD